MDHSAILMWALVSTPVAGLLWICGRRLVAARKAHYEEYLLRRAKECGKSYAVAVWLERGDLVVDEMPGETFDESLERRQFQHGWEEQAYTTEFVETLRPRVVALAKEDAKAHSYRAMFSDGTECGRNRRAFNNGELASAYEEAYQAELSRRGGGALRGFASGGFVGDGGALGLGEIAVGAPIQFGGPDAARDFAASSRSVPEEVARAVVREAVDRIVGEIELTTWFRALEDQAPGDDVAVEALVCPTHLAGQDNVPWVSCGHHTLPGGQVPPHLPEEVRRIYWQNVTEEKKPIEARPSTRPQRRLRRRPGDA